MTLNAPWTRLPHPADTATVNRLKWLDRVLITFAVAALAALVTATVVGVNSKRPGGGRSMGGLYTIALSSVVAFVVAGWPPSWA